MSSELQLGVSLPITIADSACDASFRVTDLSWSESIGRPFHSTIKVLSDDPQIDMASLLATLMTIRIDKPSGDPTYLNGFVDRMEFLGAEQRLSIYQIELVPCISLLKYSGGCRIFQNMSTPEILSKVFSDQGYDAQLSNKLSTTYSTREYCVQYNESDFNFVSRLMEEEGIYYFFDYSEESHDLILADDSSAHAKASGAEELQYRNWGDSRADEFAFGLQPINQFGTNAVMLADYDFTKPNAPMDAVQLSDDGKATPQQYTYPGNYSDQDVGKNVASLRQQEKAATKSWARLSSHYRALRAGNSFTLKDHEDEDRNIDFLVTQSEISAKLGRGQANTDQEFDFKSQLSIQDLKTPFRSACTTPRPQIHGPQVAQVCGKDGEEIWTDEYGRVKVQFPWDREGQFDEASSCWLRVTQPWTGSNFGAISIPRIGEEVVVQFIDGNPDRPLIIGRVYNANNMPPDALADAQAKTTFRTRSTSDGDQTNFHELSFDDTKDAELIYLHSERDFQRVVENNDSLEVGFDKSDPGDQTIDIYNNRTANIHQGDDNLVVQQGDLIIEASEGNVKITAASSIVLQSGDSKITLDPSSIEISSSQVTIQADGDLQMQGTNSTLEASGSLSLEGVEGTLSSDGSLTIQGAMVQIN